ncbi:type IV pilus modification protein PilV [Cardiobacterium hominis]|uniref:type IV pilus modification protein PilV n=1 Tax=Cardiobacterium hominis TaxID=2718 RepID=UPI0028EFC5A5|nr:type IV pilus modification protein PilV [Cardiobacterium hominis]
MSGKWKFLRVKLKNKYGIFMFKGIKKQEKSVQRDRLNQNIAMNKQQGMTLLEVVVSMLVVALGLVMSVSMLQTANRFGDTAEYTSFALQESQTLIDAMRANRLADETYFVNAIGVTSKDTSLEVIYNSLDAFYKFTSDDKEVVKQEVKNRLMCKNASCTEAENIAKEDMATWISEIVTLPGGRAAVGRLGDQFEVVVMWNHVAETDSNDNARIQGTRVWFTL